MARSLVCAWVFAAGIASIGSGEEGRFALGVEYMVPGLAEVYAETGVTWAKAIGMGFA